jgi:hypothetical protein
MTDAMQNHRIAMANQNEGGYNISDLPFAAGNYYAGFLGHLFGHLDADGAGNPRVAMETRSASTSAYFCIKY